MINSVFKIRRFTRNHSGSMPGDLEAAPVSDHLSEDDLHTGAAMPPAPREGRCYSQPAPESPNRSDPSTKEET